MIAHKLQGSLADATLDELIGVTDRDIAYVNVHSVDFPDGMIRSELSSQDIEEEEDD